MEDKPKSQDRREFLAKAATMGAAAAIIGTSAIVGIKASKERRERLVELKTTVVRKGEIQSYLPLMPGQNIIMNIPIAAKEVTVLIDGKEHTVTVSEDKYNALKEGEPISVRYEKSESGPKDIKVVNE